MHADPSRQLYTQQVGQMADCHLQGQHMHVHILSGLERRKTGLTRQGKKILMLEKQIVIFKLMINSACFIF